MGMPWKLRLARIEYRIALCLFDEIETMGERLGKLSTRFDRWTHALDNRYGMDFFEDIRDARFFGHRREAPPSEDA